MPEEPTLKSLLKTRFRGTLMGGAIGDALGFPFEGSSRSFMVAVGDEVTQRYEKHRSGYFPRGQYSDDTQMTLATVEAIVEAGGIEGESIAASFIPLWRENRIVGRGNACTEAVQRLMDGVADWRTSGAEEGRAGNGAAMRIAPLGLWDYDQQERLGGHVELVSRITHNDARAVAGAAAVAAAVAYNVTHREVILGDFLDFVSGVAQPFHEQMAKVIQDLPRLLSIPDQRALEMISTFGFPGAYRESHDGITPFVVSTVMLALYYFLRSPTNYEMTVRNCLLAGGDVDTTAGIAGSISGALNGIDALPKKLVEGMQSRDRILELADRFYNRKEQQRSRLPTQERP
ncbi:MAG: ADP-ribosylglycohydrolase family protein [Planctomycetota bacterium]